MPINFPELFNNVAFIICSRKISHHELPTIKRHVALRSWKISGFIGIHETFTQLKRRAHKLWLYFRKIYRLLDPFVKEKLTSHEQILSFFLYSWFILISCPGVLRSIFGKQVSNTYICLKSGMEEVLRWVSAAG